MPPKRQDEPPLKWSLSDSQGSLVVQPGRGSAQLDPRLEPAELLRRLLSPMDPAEFVRSCWAQRAVVTQGSAARLRPLLRSLHDLDIERLLNATPSERVHAWVRPASGLALESVAVDAEAAVSLARAGAALYFRAPEELEDALVSGISAALGAAFAGRYPGDAKPRGEIETFVADRGHVTGWHTDFQHNFTVQLSGTKTWKFKRGPVEHNIRALTPHYRTRANFEQQMKMHLMCDPTSVEYRPPDSFFVDAEEVVVGAGSVLYHPAGIWHHVECTSDSSISINVSLDGASWSDLIGDAMRQVLWASPLLRAPVVGLDASNLSHARTVANAVLKDAKRQIAMLTADDLLPPALLDSDGQPSRVNVASSRLGSALEVNSNDRFRFSSLAVAVLLPERSDGDGLPDDSSSESEPPSRPRGRRVAYALHANFGNEDLASWARVRLVVPHRLAPAMKWLLDRQLATRRRRAAGECGFRAGEVPGAARGWTGVARLLRVLSHCGYISKLAKDRQSKAAQSRQPAKTRGAKVVKKRGGRQG